MRSQKSMILFQLLITQFFFFEKASQYILSVMDVFYTHFLFCNGRLHVLHRGEIVCHFVCVIYSIFLVLVQIFCLNTSSMVASAPT